MSGCFFFSHSWSNGLNSIFIEMETLTNSVPQISYYSFVCYPVGGVGAHPSCSRASYQFVTGLFVHLASPS